MLEIALVLNRFDEAYPQPSDVVVILLEFVTGKLPQQTSLPFPKKRTAKKKASGQMQPVQPGKVEIAAIHDIERSRLGRNLVEHMDIVRIASGDADKRWNRSAQIEQCVHLDGGLGGAELGPREQTHA